MEIIKFSESRFCSCGVQVVIVLLFGVAGPMCDPYEDVWSLEPLKVKSIGFCEGIKLS